MSVSNTNYTLVTFQHPIEFSCKNELLPILKQRTLVDIFQKLQKEFPFKQSQKEFRIHLVQNNEDFLLTLVLRKKPYDCCQLVYMNISNEIDANNNNAGKTKREFLNEIQQYPKVIERNQDPIPSHTTQQDTTSTQQDTIPFTIQSSGPLITLSIEVTEGMQGKRDPDHCVSKKILQACFDHNNTQRKLSDFINSSEKELDLFFRIQTADGAIKLLYVDVKKFQENSKEKIVCITAYYPRSSKFKDRFSSEAQYQSFIDSRPLINLS